MQESDSVNYVTSYMQRMVCERARELGCWRMWTRGCGGHDGKGQIHFILWEWVVPTVMLVH